MLTFHNDPQVKEKYLARLRQHAVMDEIKQGATGQDGKGCAVWCTLDLYSHAAYEKELGIPAIIAAIEDRIFERLPVKESKAFPIDFLSAVPVGVDLKDVHSKLFIWNLTDASNGVIQFVKDDAGKKIIQDVADLIAKSMVEKVTPAQFEVVRNAARKARASADASASASADASASAYAYAYADAYADASAYASADASADASAYASASAYADAYADASAYVKKFVDTFYIRQAAKLIEILAATK